MLPFMACQISAATIELSVERHQQISDLTSKEFELVVRGSQRIIAKACESHWSGLCLINVTQAEFRTSGPKDTWVQTEPRTVFTETDMDEIESHSDRRRVFVYIVRHIDTCGSHLDKTVAGCTVQRHCIFLALLKYNIGKTGRPVRDKRWFEEQSFILAHELGHVAGLPDLCSDGFDDRLMFATMHVDSQKVDGKECLVFQDYPRNPSDLDIEKNTGCDHAAPPAVSKKTSKTAKTTKTTKKKDEKHPRKPTTPTVQPFLSDS
jgi:hypothetical protein